MCKKILLVDDDLNILSGYKRQLRKHFEIETEPGGQEALFAIENSGPFAVIVSDMQMPGMNGTQFLSAAREAAPDSVRIMLTGNADQQTAMDAVNDGNIFRFLTKPCSPEVLTTALEAGIEQHRLITAEHDLLSKTLSGSVSILTEVLSLVNPIAFGHTTSVRRLTHQVCQEVKVDNAWEIEIAAMLCQVGCVTIPETTLSKLSRGEAITDEEQKIYQGHPQVGYNLISKIPRLQGAADIIVYQQKCFDGSGIPEDDKKEEQIPFGARVLKLVIDVVQLMAEGKAAGKAFGLIRQRKGWYDPIIVEVLATILDTEYAVDSVTIDQLKEGMVLEEHVTNKVGDILLASGHEVTASLHERLMTFAATGMGVREPICVRCPIANQDQGKSQPEPTSNKVQPHTQR